MKKTTTKGRFVAVLALLCAMTSCAKEEPSVGTSVTTVNPIITNQPNPTPTQTPEPSTNTSPNTSTNTGTAQQKEEIQVGFVEYGDTMNKVLESFYQVNQGLDLAIVNYQKDPENAEAKQEVLNLITTMNIHLRSIRAMPSPSALSGTHQAFAGAAVNMATSFEQIALMIRQNSLGTTPESEAQLLELTGDILVHTDSFSNTGHALMETLLAHLPSDGADLSEEEEESEDGFGQNRAEAWMENWNENLDQLAQAEAELEAETETETETETGTGTGIGTGEEDTTEYLQDGQVYDSTAEVLPVIPEEAESVG